MDEPVHTTPQPFATPLGPTPSGFGAVHETKSDEAAQRLGTISAQQPNTGLTSTAPKAEDPPVTKEQHFEAIRYLIAELLKESNEHTAAYRTIHLIMPHLDAIEDKKPEKTVKW